MEALIDLDAHEDEIQLCAAKLFWSDVAEAEAIVKELKIKNRKIEQDIEVVEQELVEAVNKKNNLGDATEFSKVYFLIVNFFLEIIYCNFLFSLFI